ncbi:alpha-1,3-rhamnosyl/mannosyltransferase [Sphingobium xenophagum]|uniref:Alpha-1,3-rhamnosyl/mannosyltransferase n=1 Tax=Sphingobium xenophagum TaxID=121428 RepID=A0ABU1X0F2_SPHXE|nr:glycosyltransferase family 1 protein [Sphingobium xenophagum]MDR7155055.1 alpha-1,3-rhamnosyl/mannosyltransferase [Sphingobium xenophagum]
MSLRLILSVEALEPRLSGIGRYSWELAQRLPLMDDVEKIRFYRNGEWIVDPASLLVDRAGGPRRHIVYRWLRKHSKWARNVRDASVMRSHLFHGPNYFLPPRGEGGVITVHDLSIFRYPETHPAARLRQFERYFRLSVERAAHIITDTETTRAEVASFLAIDPAMVTAVPLAASPDFHPRTDAAIAPTLARYDLMPQGYALCVSTVEPRKRIAELLFAWEKLPPSVRNRWPLMVTGGAGWLSDVVKERMIKGAREGWVRYLGFVPDADLPLLYAGAALFVYPSVYEGFGLPPVEAMASGVPVVVADASCLPEVTGGAAMLVAPEDIDAFASRLEQALVDDGWREQARTAGLRVASGYSWDRCARETMDVYRKLR